MNQEIPTADRRNVQDSIEAYYADSRNNVDPKTGRTVVKIFTGDWHVSKRPNEMLVTILGSCISACIRDPLIGVGGMNHFLLPGDDANIDRFSDATRFGICAMETLINEILKAGGVKSRLEVKVFGGGNVLNNSTKIGSKNATFVRNFLRDEGFTITSQDLEGDYPRRIHYFPDTGQVMLRKLRRAEDRLVVEEEKRYSQSISKAPVEGDIDLF